MSDFFNLLVYNFRGFEEGSAAALSLATFLPAITSWRFCGHGGLEEFSVVITII